jgi:hypothetical protein
MRLVSSTLHSTSDVAGGGTAGAGAGAATLASGAFGPQFHTNNPKWNSTDTTTTTTTTIPTI